MNGGLRGAVAFLTPVGGAAAPTPGALVWFPAVGAVTGAGVGAVWWLAARVWPAAVAAGLAVVADLALTGLLHFDGLADAADGLLPPLSLDQRLRVMAAPDVGAFGVAACVAALILRTAAFGSMRPSILLVAGLWAASRTAMAVTTMAMPYARAEGGLASAFRPGVASSSHLVLVLAVGVVGSLVLTAGWRPAVGPAAVLGLALGTGLVLALAWRRLGGFTGDVLGAAGVVGETFGLIVACARW